MKSMSYRSTNNHCHSCPYRTYLSIRDDRPRQVLFPWRANGSLVTDEKGQVVGSELIAQGFANPAYFQPRPSAAGENGYDAANFIRFQSRTDVEEVAGSHQRRSQTA